MYRDTKSHPPLHAAASAALPSRVTLTLHPHEVAASREGVDYKDDPCCLNRRAPRTAMRWMG